MKKIAFLCTSPKDLEDETAIEIIKTHPYEADIIDITYQLNRYNDDQLKNYIVQLVDEYFDIYLFDNVPTSRFESVMTPGMICLKKEASICPLIQVSALLHHRLTHHEILVASYATDGITGLREAGATKVEIDYIVLRNKLAHSALPMETITGIRARAEVEKDYFDEGCYF